MKVNDIRSTFLQYFASKGHEVVDSSSLVPKQDSTLLFTNAGMVQFKNIFTGLEARKYKRAVTAQKCVRAGGKHNDLENVGYTARHHTFFEMLGNFSFGDYFKEQAIKFAWDLLIKEYGLPKDRLLVTVYHDDDEAATWWKKIAGLSRDKIIPIATSDNFWQMGDVGPCGPCTEIFYDHGEKILGGRPGTHNEDGDRFIEIWNLVFMQFNQVAENTRELLPNPSIDTGMGLERMAAILQGKHNNYDIDTLCVIIESVAHMAKVNPSNPSLKVIADHLRSTAFLIADGVLPDKEGRGYVLRRIMRRAMRHVHLLGVAEPLLYKLIPVVCKEMAHYGELHRAQSLITKTVKLEEIRFRETLERGLKLLEKETAKLGDKESLGGDVAFTLYDTYGFPLDLTQDIVREQGRLVDVEGFTQAMNRQKEVARSSWIGSDASKCEAVWFTVRKKFGATEFLGYHKTCAEGKILTFVKDGSVVEGLNAKEEGILIANKTPFYGESGGQVGDTGTIATSTAHLEVLDTKKVLDDVFLHFVKVRDGSFHVGDDMVMRVDGQRRAKITANHSATHVLHQALRNRLGKHVAQRGSLQNEFLTRFDISHPSPLTQQDIRDVELEVNRQIIANNPVLTKIVTPEEGRALGALALFGEKYGDRVRVVSMGNKHIEGDEDPYSVELCGGTHVKSTGEIGAFKIISERAVSSGVRRIEAITGSAVIEYIYQNEAVLRHVATTLKTSITDIPHKVDLLWQNVKVLEKQVTTLQRNLATAGGQKNETYEKIRGVTFVHKVVDFPAKDLKGVADEVKRQAEDPCVIVVISTVEGKVSVVVSTTSVAHNAVDLVRVASRVLGGKGGGGRPDMAQAGGFDSAKIPLAIEAVKEHL